ncbi:Integral membrane protein [Lasiodiplodia theobromae]|uniref:Integral membrane protein n=1 Tax=Lasiodiplodia theobromae TaxID=45133 RepID=UPI0015C3150D|nr:Integral membrane protein [Lasiodiplodia theobromae]KAF4536879.1 Integral membrane protein [Lasiodiplodia theobromae]
MASTASPTAPPTASPTAPPTASNSTDSMISTASSTASTGFTASTARLTVPLLARPAARLASRARRIRSSAPTNLWELTILVAAVVLGVAILLDVVAILANFGRNLRPMSIPMDRQYDYNALLDKTLRDAAEVVDSYLRPPPEPVEATRTEQWRALLEITLHRVDNGYLTRWAVYDTDNQTARLIELHKFLEETCNTIETVYNYVTSPFISVSNFRNLTTRFTYQMANLDMIAGRNHGNICESLEMDSFKESRWAPQELLTVLRQNVAAFVAGVRRWDADDFYNRINSTRKSFQTTALIGKNPATTKTATIMVVRLSTSTITYNSTEEMLLVASTAPQRKPGLRTCSNDGQHIYSDKPWHSSSNDGQHLTASYFSDDGVGRNDRQGAPRLLASASRTTDSTSTQKVLDTDLPTTKSRSTQTDLDTDPPTGHVPSLLASHRQYGAHIASSTSFSATDRRPTSDKNFCDLAKAYIELANIAKEYLEPAKLTKDHFELVKDDIPATTSRRDLTQQLIKDEVTATTSRRNWLQKLVKDDVPATTSRRDSTQQLDSIRRPPSPSFQAWLPRDIGRQDVIKPSQKSQMPGSFPQDAPSSRELLTDGGGSPPTTTLSALGALRSKLDQETLIKAESRDEPTDDEDGADYGSVVSEKPEESEEDVVATKQHTPARKRCAALIQNGKRRCKNRASEGKTRCPQHLKIQNKRVAENVDKWFKKENAKPVASHPPTEPETTQMHSNLPLAGPLSRTARPDQHDYDDHGANKAGSSTVRGQGRKGGSALASLDDDDGDSGTVAASGRPSHEEAQMTVAEPNIANKRAVAEQRWANVEKEGKEALGGV